MEIAGHKVRKATTRTNNRLMNLRRCWHRRYVLANHARAIRCQKPPFVGAQQEERGPFEGSPH
jgi:hypothetical protein